MQVIVIIPHTVKKRTTKVKRVLKGVVYLVGRKLPINRNFLQLGPESGSLVDCARYVSEVSASRLLVFIHSRRPMRGNFPPGSVSEQLGSANPAIHDCG